MTRYFDVDKISSYIRENFSIDKTKNADICFAFIDLMNWLDDQPTADVVEVETIKSWLYEMAINNVGYVIDGDFSDACQEIISRLDGLRKFTQERKSKNDFKE